MLGACRGSLQELRLRFEISRAARTFNHPLPQAHPAECGKASEPAEEQAQDQSRPMRGQSVAPASTAPGAASSVGAANSSLRPIRALGTYTSPPLLHDLSALFKVGYRTRALNPGGGRREAAEAPGLPLAGTRHRPANPPYNPGAFRLDPTKARPVLMHEPRGGLADGLPLLLRARRARRQRFHAAARRVERFVLGRIGRLAGGSVPV
mmetsp:Transcript_16280/g.53018  ORF Transcript_16280/g.53018 Transcript_16280/m.53018 type:complete len:208 (+) Transcript_16280:243-866(+)